MLIPVRCYTCGKVIGNKYSKYLEMAKKYHSSKDDKIVTGEEFAIQSGAIKRPDQRTPEGKAMDDIGLTRYCCRRMMLTHVDIIKNV